MPDNKAKYISVAVITEGEQSRATISGSPPAPPTGVLWAVTTSCKFLPFSLTQTGNTAPLIPLTAVAPTGTPRTFTLFDIDVDNAGNQYMLRGVTDTGVSLDSFEIDVFAPGTTGSPATITRSIAGASTNLDLFTNSSEGGICLNTANTLIYAANGPYIISFPIAASGDSPGTVLVSTSSVIFTRIYYDNPRSFLWVSCGAGDGPGIRAYDLSGTLQRTIACSLLWNPSDSIDTITIDADGFIYGGIGSKNVDGTFASVIYVFSPSADGDSVPVRTIQINNGGGDFLGIDLDRSTNHLYAAWNAPPSTIASVPNADGVYEPAQWLTNLSGAATLLDYDFGDPDITDGVQEIRVISHYP